MGSKKYRDNTPPVGAVIATFVIVLLAAAAVAALFLLPKQKNDESRPALPDGTVVSFKPSQELIDECGANAQELIRKNLTIIKLFVSEGLPHLSEPYGNRPDGGFYTVESDDYKAFADIEKLVKSVYVEEEAERILTRMPAEPEAEITGSGETEYIAVFGEREIFVEASEIEESGGSSDPKVPEVVIPEPDEEEQPEQWWWDYGEEEESEEPAPEAPVYVKKKVLGINADFKPYENYHRSWGSLSIKILPTNVNECYITVYLGSNENVDLSSVGEADIFNATMIKEDNKWRLTKMLY